MIEILERLVRDGSSKINPTGNVQRDASAGHYASFGAYDDLRPSNDPQATANYEHNSRCQGVRSVLGDSDARREIAGSSRRSARAIQLPSWRILPGTLREDADDGRVGVVEATAPSPACSLGSPESPSRPSSSRSTSSPRASGACQSHAPLSSGSSCSTVSDSPPPASRPRVRLDGGALDQLLDLRRVSKVVSDKCRHKRGARSSQPATGQLTFLAMPFAVTLSVRPTDRRDAFTLAPYRHFRIATDTVRSDSPTSGLRRMGAIRTGHLGRAAVLTRRRCHLRLYFSAHNRSRVQWRLARIPRARSVSAATLFWRQSCLVYTFFHCTGTDKAPPIPAAARPGTTASPCGRARPRDQRPSR